MLKQVAAAAFAAAALSGAAFASSDQKAVDLCLESLEAAIPADSDVEFRFKGLRGASVQTAKFEARSDGETQMVTCKVRRGEILAVEWAGDGPVYASK